jgi:hypothetical protein
MRGDEDTAIASSELATACIGAHAAGHDAPHGAPHVASKLPSMLPRMLLHMLLRMLSMRLRIQNTFYLAKLVSAVVRQGLNRLSCG